MDSKSSKAKRFQDMFSFFEEGLVTVEQADELFKAIIDIIEKFQKKTDLSLTEQDQAIADFGYQIANIYAQMTDQIGGQKVSFEKQIAELKKEIADIVVEDGEDADEDEIVERVLDVVEDRLEEVRSLIPDIKEKTAEELLDLIGDIPLNQVSGLDGRLQEMNNDMHKLSNELVNKVPRIEVFSSGEKIGSAHRINFTGATVTFENGRVNVAVTGGGGISDGDKGDITVSGSGTVWTIANDAVTYAKMQNVVANNVLLGNNSGAGGIVAELTASEVRTILNVADGATANAGTVTSVAVSGSDGLEVDSGSPITSSGTIALGVNKTNMLSHLNVEDGADVTDETNVVAALSGATLSDVGAPASGDKILLLDASDADNLKYATFDEFGGGGGNNYFNNTFIDQSGGTSDTYGVLAGSVNGSNTTFTVSEGVYSTGTLKVWLNGQLQTQGTSEDWDETTPASGTFDFNTPPQVGDLITVEYQTATLSGDTVLTTDDIGVTVAAFGSTGLSRTVVVTSGSATMGSTAATDYVYIVTGAHTMSLPAASGNTNLYIIKNNHSANITIDTVGAETIDGAASISLAPEESVGIISDGTNFYII